MISKNIPQGLALNIEKNLKIKLQKTDFVSEKVKFPIKTVIINDFVGEGNKDFLNQISQLIIDLSAESSLGFVLVLPRIGMITELFKEKGLELKEKELEMIYFGVSGGQDKVRHFVESAKKPVFVTTLYGLKKTNLRREIFGSVILQKLPSQAPKKLEQKTGQGDFLGVALPRAVLAFQEITELLKGDQKEKNLIILDSRLKSANYSQAFFEVLDEAKLLYTDRNEFSLKLST
jgi:hypothetical protein